MKITNKYKLISIAYNCFIKIIGTMFEHGKLVSLHPNLQSICTLMLFIGTNLTF